MIIQCPSCKRKYRLEEGLARTPYQRMRCSRCGHVFVYERVAPVRDAGKAEAAPAPAEPPEETRAKGGSSRLTLGLVCLGILGALALAAYIYWVNYLGAADRWLSIRKVVGQEVPVRDGWVFFVRGVVVNGSTKPRKYVILKARLFDGQGTVLDERFALVGLPLSLEEVQQMQKAGLERKVADFRLSSLSTFILRNGKELPFSIIFPDSYAGKVKEFTTEIVESPPL
jgi:predicted Zn finger-like uncharacterized protein